MIWVMVAMVEVMVVACGGSSRDGWRVVVVVMVVWAVW